MSYGQVRSIIEMFVSHVWSTEPGTRSANVNVEEGVAHPTNQRHCSHFGVRDLRVDIIPFLARA